MDRRRRKIFTILTPQMQFSKGKTLFYDVKSQKFSLRGCLGRGEILGLGFYVGLHSPGPNAPKYIPLGPGPSGAQGPGRPGP